MSQNNLHLDVNVGYDDEKDSFFIQVSPMMFSLFLEALGDGINMHGSSVTFHLSPRAEEKYNEHSTEDTTKD